MDSCLRRNDVCLVRASDRRRIPHDSSAMDWGSLLGALLGFLSGADLGVGHLFEDLDGCGEALDSQDLELGPV